MQVGEAPVVIPPTTHTGSLKMHHKATWQTHTLSVKIRCVEEHQDMQYSTTDTCATMMADWCHKWKSQLF